MIVMAWWICSSFIAAFIVKRLALRLTSFIIAVLAIASLLITIGFITASLEQISTLTTFLLSFLALANYFAPDSTYSSPLTSSHSAYSLSS